MSSAFVDTSFVVALVNKADQYHVKAVAVADSVEGQELLITDAVLLEIGNALSRNFKKESIEIIEHFLSSDDVRVVHLHPSLFRQAFELYKTHTDKLWGLVDCLSFVVMGEFGVVDALTADKHFEQAGFNVLIKF